MRGVRSLAVFLAALAVVAASQVFAGDWEDVASISSTLGVNANRVCIGDGTRGSIGCPTYSPTVSTTGLLTATTMSTGGLTVIGVMSLENSAGNNTTFITDSSGNLTATNSAPSGHISINPNGNLYLGNAVTDAIQIGRSDVIGFGINLRTYNSTATLYAVDGKIGVLNNAPSTTLHVSGTLRLSNGGEVCDANRTGAIRYTGGDFSVCRNGSAWETLTSVANGGTSDRISSTNNQAMALATAGGTISYTLGGTAGAAYLHPTLGFVGAGVSTTGGISGTTGYFSNKITVGAGSQSYDLSLNTTSSITVAKFGGNDSLYFSRSYPTIGFDTYWNGSNWAYAGTGNYPAYIQQNTSAGKFSIVVSSVSGTAGGIAPMNSVLTITSATNMGVGVQNPVAKLEVKGTASATAIIIAPQVASSCPAADIGKIVFDSVRQKYVVCRE